jgi:hypothetical protein
MNIENLPKVRLIMYCLQKIQLNPNSRQIFIEETNIFKS